MLLSNLLTNSDIRAHIRYLSWHDPMTNILQTGPCETVLQVVRCIVNICFDDHCRHICVKQGFSGKLKNAASRVRNSDVEDLVKTACSNLEVLVSGDVQREVDDALRSGRVQRVNAPVASQREQATNDFEGLDDLLGGSSHKPVPSKQAVKPSAAALDDLDSLLEGVSKPKPTPVVQKPVTTTAQKPYTPPPQQQAQKPKDDLDDLLAGVSATAPTQRTATAGRSATSSKPVNFDDLDDLLSGIGGSTNTASKSTQSKTQTRTADDLDDLIGNLSPPKRNNNNDLDDIDSLLADLGGSSTKKTTLQHQNS